MRKLLILRHGMTEANEKKVFSGGRDIPLSARGRELLAPMRDRMPAAAMFFTSGMLRAKQTLEILYGPVKSVSIPELAEYRFGAFEMRGHDDLFENEPIYRLWLSEDALDVACPGGESRRVFSRRVQEGMRVLTAYEWTGLAVLVTHGGVIHEIAGIDDYPGNGEGVLAEITDTGRFIPESRFRIC